METAPVLNKNTKKLLGLSLTSLSIGLFIRLTWEFWEKDKTLRIIDRTILLYFEKLRTNVLNGPAVDITAMGSLTFCLILSSVIIIVLWLAKEKEALVHYALALTGAGLWTFILKHLIARTRPTEVSQLISVSGYSYPSGHALVSTAIYLTLAFLGFRYFVSWQSRVILFSLALFISGLISLSRIYLGAHYPSDVLSGAFLGSGWAFFLATFYFHKYDKIRTIDKK